jgi:hypothetical protein
MATQQRHSWVKQGSGDLAFTSTTHVPAFFQQSASQRGVLLNSQPRGGADVALHDAKDLHCVVGVIAACEHQHRGGRRCEELAGSLRASLRPLLAAPCRAAATAAVPTRQCTRSRAPSHATVPALGAEKSHAGCGSQYGLHSPRRPPAEHGHAAGRCECGHARLAYVRCAVQRVIAPALQRVIAPALQRDIHTPATPTHRPAGAPPSV